MMNAERRNSMDTPAMGDRSCRWSGLGREGQGRRDRVAQVSPAARQARTDFHQKFREREFPTEPDVLVRLTPADVADPAAPAMALIDLVAAPDWSQARAKDDGASSSAALKWTIESKSIPRRALPSSHATNTVSTSVGENSRSWSTAQREIDSVNLARLQRDGISRLTCQEPKDTISNAYP